MVGPDLVGNASRDDCPRKPQQASGRLRLGATQISRCLGNVFPVALFSDATRQSRPGAAKKKKEPPTTKNSVHAPARRETLGRREHSQLPFCVGDKASQQKDAGSNAVSLNSGKTTKFARLLFLGQRQIRWFSPSLLIHSFVFRREESRDACIFRKRSRPPEMRTRVRAPRNLADGALPAGEEVRGEV